MTDSKRFLSIYPIAAFLIFGALYSIAVWSCSLGTIASYPRYFTTAINYIKGDPWPNVVYAFYQNTLVFLFLFIGIGLCGMKKWAYRLLIGALIAGMIEKAAQAVWMGASQHVPIHIILQAVSLRIFVSALLLLFLLRKQFRLAFLGDASPAVPPGVDLPAGIQLPATGVPGSGELHPLIAAKLKEQQGSAGKKRFSDYFIGFSSTMKWLVYLGVIGFSIWVYKLDGLGAFVMCVFWGIDTFIMGIWMERARKLIVIAGAIAAIVTYWFLFGWIVARHGDDFWTVVFYGGMARAGGDIVGAILSAKFAKDDEWYQGAAVGCLTATIYTAIAVTVYGTGLHQMMNQNHKLEVWFHAFPVLAVVVYAFQLIIGFIVGSFGGFIGASLTFRTKE